MRETFTTSSKIKVLNLAYDVANHVEEVARCANNETIYTDVFQKDLISLIEAVIDDRIQEER